ncbi:MAG: TIGR04282 family arsenosugar biosynthesis glycosyltransferase [Anaerolineae bacterium]
MVRRRLIVYAKRPLPGHAKTRLGATIGMEQAAGVYARLLYTYLLNIAANTSGITVELSLASAEDVDFFAAAFPEFVVRTQSEGDLGDRMARSFEQAYRESAEHVVLTGSDIPELSISAVRDAFAALQKPVERRTNRIAGIVGPTTDGGYYLIGLQAPGADLFSAIDWSTDRVLHQTEVAARREHVALTHLQTMNDIDELPEYEVWWKQHNPVQASPEFLKTAQQLAEG